MTLTKNQYNELLGLATLALGRRQELNSIEGSICGFLKARGVEETDADTWSGELVFNEGDDPVAAVRRILDVLDLEVEE